MNRNVQENYPMINVQATAMRLKALMIRNGITVRDVSRYLGLASLQSVYHWLEGKSLPSVDNLYALSALFGVTMDSIIKGNKEGKSIDWLGATSTCERLETYHLKFTERKAG